MKAYLFLAAAIVLETVATSALKASAQFTRLWPSVITVLAYGGTFFLLSMALKDIPVGAAYAIWAGLGIVLVTVAGAVAFHQRPDLPAILGIALIVAGVVVMSLFSKMEVH